MTKTSHTLFPLNPCPASATSPAGRAFVQLAENYAAMSTTRVKREYQAGHQLEVLERAHARKFILCRDSTGCRVYLPAGLLEPVNRDGGGDDDAQSQPAGGNDGDDTGGGPVGELAAAAVAEGGGE